MFEKCPKIEAMEQALMDATSLLERGNLIPLSTIEHITGLVRYVGQWGHLIKQFRKRLLNERGIAMRPVKNEGYALCTEEEQYITYCPRMRQKKMLRQNTRGQKELKAGTASGLSLHQQKMRAMNLQHMRDERRVITSRLREQNREQARSDVVPARPVPREVALQG